MSKFQIRIQSADGTAEQQVVDTATGKPVVIQAKAKTTYTLQPEAGGAMPQGVVVKRVGNSLKVFFPPQGENAEAEESADLEVLGYFEAPEQVLQGVAKCKHRVKMACGTPLPRPHP